MKIHLPSPTELSDYYKSYLKYVQTDDLLDELKKQQITTQSFLKSITTEKEIYVYEPGKWTIRQITGHMTDVELILLYRALCFARKDRTKLPGFDEDSYEENANHNELTLTVLQNQLFAVREASIATFDSFDKSFFDNTGIANNNMVSVRAILFFIIGHQYHHLEVIKRRYLNG